MQVEQAECVLGLHLHLLVDRWTVQRTAGDATRVVADDAVAGGQLLCQCLEHGRVRGAAGNQQQQGPAAADLDVQPGTGDVHNFGLKCGHRLLQELRGVGGSPE
ncbi:hypothetical protein ATKI12_4109 [Kitasatospora sp. Ki12]